MRFSAQQLVALIRKHIAKNTSLPEAKHKWPLRYVREYAKLFVGTHAFQMFVSYFAIACDKEELDPFSAAHKAVEAYGAKHPRKWTGSTVNSIVTYCRRHVGTSYTNVFLSHLDKNNPSCAVEVHARLRKFGPRPFPLLSLEPHLMS